MRYSKVYFIIRYDTQIPLAKSKRSAITVGINEFQTGAGKFKAQIQAAPPTAWAVKVAPKLLKNKLSFLKLARTGIVQKSE